MERLFTKDIVNGISKTKETTAMYEAKLIAIVTEKRNKDISTWYVMELKYNVKDNVLWITDYRGHIVDFDLDEFNVEIKMVKE